MYADHMGMLPPDLKALLIPPTNSQKWQGPYFDTSYPGSYSTGVLLDPWGKPFHYAAVDPAKRAYRIWSSGPDGLSGTNDDIETLSP